MNTKIAHFAMKAHSDVKHFYDGQPYACHLVDVVTVAQKYIHLIPDEDRETVLSACWLHDTIEDCRLTYNDIKKKAGEKVADIVYAVTNEKGKTRKDRANEKYYQGIAQTPYAGFVKMCDRIANITYSQRTKSRMFSMYCKENEDFITSLGLHKHYKEMVEDLREVASNLALPCTIRRGPRII